MSLDALRSQLAELDEQLLAIVARRQQLSSEVGRVKREAGVPVRDYRQERDVMRRTRQRAHALGLPSGLAERLLLLLVESSLTVQEQDQVAAQGTGDGRENR